MMNALEALHQHRTTRKELLDRLEDNLRAQPPELRAHFAPEIIEHWAPGLYAREMRLKAGATVTSLVHRYEGLAVLSRGVLDLFMHDGTVKRVSAGFHIVAPAGTRRAAICIEDATWTSFHPTELTDTDAIRAHFTCATEDEFLEWAADQERIANTAEGE